MKDDVLNYVRDYVSEVSSCYLPLIRGYNSSAFTRNRKVLPHQLFLQMFNNRGLSQKAELLNFYENMDANLDISQTAFYNARMKFNPNALKVMSNDFISEIYDKENESIVKLNGYLVTAVDGSDFILPSTDENELVYGRPKLAVSDKKGPVMGKLSIIYDCINKMIFDTCIGEYKHSEFDFASNHLEVLKDTVRTPTISVFDRGYYSIRLVNQMIDNEQKFVFRLKDNILKRYTDTVMPGEDKVVSVTFNRANTNRYREDTPFRMKLMSTVYYLRICKIKLLDAKGKELIETLVTNLDADEFDKSALEEIYHLRWNIETAYNELKNRMKIEEFSGYRDTIIRQDIYVSVWLYNIIMLLIIEANEKNEIPQDRYKYKMNVNVNMAIGIVKTNFVKAMMLENPEEKRINQEKMHTSIMKYLVPVRPKRTWERRKLGNKTRTSYRYTY